MAGEPGGEFLVAELDDLVATAGVTEAAEFEGDFAEALPADVAIFNFVQGFQFLGEFGCAVLQFLHFRNQRVGFALAKFYLRTQLAQLAFQRQRTR